MTSLRNFRRDFAPGNSIRGAAAGRIGQVRAQITPDLADIMRREFEAGERAVQSSLRAAGDSIKADWRSQILRAGLGARLSKTIRSEVYPKGQPSINAAGLVYARAADIISSFERGATIRAQNGSWLAVPLPAAGKGRGGRRPTPEEWERQKGVKLQFIFRRGQPSLLIAEARLSKRGVAARSRSKTGRNVASVPIFLMLPQVSLRKRLSLLSKADRMADAVPFRIVTAWGKEAEK